MISGKKHLIYTIVFDPPGSEGCRTLAKLLVASLLRTFFTGDILVFRNSVNPLYMVERKGLEEIYMETPEIRNIEGAEYAWSMKYGSRYEVVKWMEEHGGICSFDKVMFLDADCFVLRDLEHLLSGEWDISFQPEWNMPIDMSQFNGFFSDEDRASLSGYGVNSGTLAVAANRYQEVMEQWEHIDGSKKGEIACRDQSSWNKLLIDTKLKKKPFEKYEIQFPVYHDLDFKNYKDAAILHTVGTNTIDKIRFTFGMYVNTFFCDPSALMLNLLEH